MSASTIARGLLQSASVIALATLASRVLGLVREVALAHQFGASAAYDAFLIAFLLPHLLRKLLAEGALSAAFTPLFAAFRAEDPDRAARFAHNAITVALVGLPVVAALGVALAPQLVALLADGFSPDKQALATRLARWTFPFVMLVGWAALAMGVLHGHERYLAPALAPVGFNVGLIVGALGIAPHVEPSALGLAWGVLLGGVGMLLMQVPLVWGRVAYRPRLALDDPDLRRMGAMMGPMVLGLIVVELNALVDYKLASHLRDGAIASLQYAIRLFQVPLGVLAVAVGTALLPRLSRQAERPNREGFRDTLDNGLQLAALVLWPATAGLLALSEPIVGLLFEHGAFNAQDATRTLGVLRGLALGIPGYGAAFVATRAFYALGDARTPMTVTGVGVAVNIALDLVLVDPLAVQGLAIATAVAGTVQGGLLLRLLALRMDDAPGIRPALRNGGTMALAALAMGAIVGGLDQGIARGGLAIGDAGRVAVGLSVGIAGYAALVGWSPSVRQLLKASGVTIRDASD